MAWMLGAAALALASGGALGARITAYNSFSGEKGALVLYANVRVRARLDERAVMHINFNVNKGNSVVAADAAGGRAAVYFDSAAYLVPSNPAAATNIAVFADFEQPGKNGVYLGSGIVGAGKPTKEVAKHRLAITKCATPLAMCTFTDAGGTPFTLDMAAMHDTVQAEGTRLAFENGDSVLIGGGDFNSFVKGREWRLAPARHGLTVWANSTHAALYRPPGMSDGMQSMVGMAIMIGAMVAFVDVSKSTTNAMSTLSPMTADNFERLVSYVVVDVASSAFLVVAWAVATRDVVFEEEPFARGASRTMLDASALFVTACAFAVSAVVVYDRGKTNLFAENVREALWVWNRCGYESAVMITAGSLAPGTAGFTFLVRYMMAFVISVVVGRDIRFVVAHAPRCAWLVNLTAVHGGAIIAVAAADLMAPIFWMSNSFPRTHYFVETLAACVVSIGAIIGTDMTRAAKSNVRAHAEDAQGEKANNANYM